jgi:hypothetical protein
LKIVKPKLKDPQQVVERRQKHVFFSNKRSDIFVFFFGGTHPLAIEATVGAAKESKASQQKRKQQGFVLIGSLAGRIVGEYEAVMLYCNWRISRSRQG